MYLTRFYTLFFIALLAGSCSKWNVADKSIKPDGTTPNPGNLGSGAVTLNSVKPIQLGHITATISFKVEKPQGITEYGAVITPDPNQVNAVIAGTAAPLQVTEAKAFPGSGTVELNLTGLTQNSLYFAVPYVKDGAGKKTFCSTAVEFRTKYGANNANWRQLANLPTKNAYAFNPLFTINGKVYVGGADNEGPKGGYYYMKQLYEYDPQNNLWKKRKDFPGTPRFDATVVVLNNKAYVLFGVNADRNSYTSDAWEYDPATDNWRQLASPPSQGQYSQPAGAIPFVSNNRMGILFGRGTFNNDVKLNSVYNSLYTLDPAANTWAVSFPLNERGYANDLIFAAARSGAFSVQYDKWVYFGGGYAANTYTNMSATIPYSRYFNSRQIWGYNVETKETKQIALLPKDFNDCSDPQATGGNMTGFAFGVGTKAYITDCSSQMWVMDLVSGNFTPQLSAALRHPAPTTGIGVGVGNKAYFGLRNADWWEFSPN